MTDNLRKLNEKIKETYNNVQRQNQIEHQIQAIAKKLKYKDKDLKNLHRILLKEEDDVIQLEKMSLRSLFIKYLGDFDERLEVERQEHLHAYLQYDSCLKSIEAMHFEQGVLKKINSELFQTKKHLTELLKRKRYVLRNSHQKEANDLMRSENKILAHEARILEIEQTIKAGNNVLIKLLKLIGQFGNIKTWGAFEYYGKGSLSSSKKKMYIRNAKKMISDTKVLLDKFETQVHSVSNRQSLDYNLFLKAFDDFINIFYDALITDWIVQKKIKNASNSLINFKDKVDRIVHMLKHEIEITESYIKEERAEIDKLLLGVK